MAPFDSLPPDESRGSLPTLAGDPGEPRGPAPPPSHRRRRGAVLGLGSLIAIGVAALIVVLVSSGNDKSPGSSSSSSTLAADPASSTASASSAPTRTGSTSPTKIVAQITLMTPHGRGRASGIAEILRQGNRNAIAIVAQGLARNRGEPPDAYAVWLYNSPRHSHILGFADPGVAADGRLQTTGELPANAARYREVVVTLETKAQPRRPGTIVLSGTLTGLDRPRR